jgi:hypothetical protein
MASPGAGLVFGVQVRCCGDILSLLWRAMKRFGEGEFGNDGKNAD